MDPQRIWIGFGWSIRAQRLVNASWAEVGAVKWVIEFKIKLPGCRSVVAGRLKRQHTPHTAGNFEHPPKSSQVRRHISETLKIAQPSSNYNLDVNSDTEFQVFGIPQGMLA